MSEAAAIGQDGVVTEATVSPMDHYGDLYRYAYARLGSVEDAEDLAIEVIERASRRKGRCTDRLLLLHAARNKVIDRLRKRSRRNKRQYEPCQAARALNFVTLARDALLSGLNFIFLAAPFDPLLLLVFGLVGGVDRCAFCA